MAEEPKSEEAPGVGVLRIDTSLVNLLSGLGGRKDRTTQNRVGEGTELEQRELEILYRFNHYAARTVDLVPNEATRRGFTISVEDFEDEDSESDEDRGSNPFENDVERLGLMRKLNRAGKWARLYGGSALILGIDDGRPFDEPVDEDNISSIRWAHVVDRHALTRGPLDEDPESEGFLSPETYTVHFREGATAFLEREADGVDINSGDKVHASRMVRFFGIELPDELKSEQDYWGDSVLQRVSEALSNLGMTEKAMGNIVHTFTQAILKIKGLRKLIKSKNGKKDLEELLEAHALSESLLGMLVLDEEGEDFERRTTTVTGIEKLYDRIAQSFGAATGFPLTLLFGTPPAGLSTDDEAGARNFENKTRSEQEEVYIPAIKRVLELVALSDEGPTIDGPIVVEAVPLREPTEKEQADAAKTWAEFAAILIDRGVLRASEVRNSWFGGAGFTTDIVLENDERDVEERRTFEPPPGTPSEVPAQEGVEIGDVALEIDEREFFSVAQALRIPPEILMEQIRRFGREHFERLRDELREQGDGLVVETSLPPVEPRKGEPRSDTNPDDGRPESIDQASVSYVDRSPGLETCDRCEWFFDPDRCAIVSGEISPDGWCRLWGTLRLADRREREDLFSSISDLPEISFEVGGETFELRELSESLRRQWMEVFNSVFRETEGSESDKESAAFVQANGVIRKRLED